MFFIRNDDDDNNLIFFEPGLKKLCNSKQEQESH